jgi:hypothetical protein
MKSMLQSVDSSTNYRGGALVSICSANVDLCIDDRLLTIFLHLPQGRSSSNFQSVVVFMLVALFVCN